MFNNYSYQFVSLFSVLFCFVCLSFSLLSFLYSNSHASNKTVRCQLPLRPLQSSVLSSPLLITPDPFQNHFSSTAGSPLLQTVISEIYLSISGNLNIYPSSIMVYNKKNITKKNINQIVEKDEDIHIRNLHDKSIRFPISYSVLILL